VAPHSLGGEKLWREQCATFYQIRVCFRTEEQELKKQRTAKETEFPIILSSKARGSKGIVVGQQNRSVGLGGFEGKGRWIAKCEKGRDCEGLESTNPSERESLGNQKRTEQRQS